MTVAPFTTQIELDDQGRAWIAGTGVKVKEIVLDKLAWGWDADEIHRNHPNLSLAQVHAAFSWYYDNKKALDAQIAKDEADVERMVAEVSDPAFRSRLARLRRTP